jgi:hypothetical protein
MLRPAELIEPLWVLIKVGKKKNSNQSREKRTPKKKKGKQKGNRHSITCVLPFSTLRGLKETTRAMKKGKRKEGGGREKGRKTTSEMDRRRTRERRAFCS